MSMLELAQMETDALPPDFTCGVSSIDYQIKDAYYKCISKQASAYNIIVDGITVGNCMIRIASIEDEEFMTSDPTYAAIEISYIAVDERIQRHGIGTKVLEMLVVKACKIAAVLPVRFLVLNALPEKREWYEKNGFREYKRVEDPRYPGTVHMAMDFVDRKKIEDYLESLS